MERIFGIAEARCRLSEIIKLSQDGPVIITFHGRPVAVLIGIKGLTLEQLVTAGSTATPLELLALAKRAREENASDESETSVESVPPSAPQT